MSGEATAPASTNASKVSKFAAKSGFVIPKNKLSGSLVPLFRAKKLGSNDMVSEDSAKGNQRKTKWGPDPTQDASVRKGRALAYQTRVEQITQQLKSGMSNVGNSEELSSAARGSDQKTSSRQMEVEELEVLELERREAVGEILKLNSSYKAPSDYKPLLKDARIPIPVKEYPGYNFIGLIFGPGSDTHKRFEKETGAKIQVYGIKAESGEKVEILPSDGTEVQSVYDELYVQISADTFEKVDAAASLIELLVTSVSGNLATVPTSASFVADVNLPSQTQDASTTPAVSTAMPEGSVQPLVGSQNHLQSKFQNPVNWFQGLLSQTPVPPSSSFVPPLTLTQPANSTLLPSNPSNMSSRFGQLSTASAYNPLPTNNLGLTGPPRIHHMPVLQPQSTQPNVLSPSPYGQAPPTARAPTSALPQPAASLPGRPLHDQQLTPRGSSGWVRGQAGAPGSSGWVRGQAGASVASPHGPYHVGPYPTSASATLPPNISAGNMVSPRPLLSQPSAPQISGSTMNRPTAAPHASMPAQPGFPAAQSAAISFPVASSSALPHQQAGISSSISGSSMNYAPIQLPTNSNSGNFTFQPHLLPNPAPQRVPGPSGQLAAQNPLPTQAPTSQPPAFQPAVPTSTPHVMQGPRPHVGQVVQPQFQVAAGPRFGNPASEFLPPTTVSDANAGLVGVRASVPHMGPRSFSPALQMPTLAGPFTHRPPVPLQQNFRAFNTRPENLTSTNQQFSMKPSPRGQTYDPFSPTSVSFAAQQQGSSMGNIRRQETDPEYEDLMASVGVK